MYVRTAVELREDIYQALKKEVGEKEKEMSEKINEILYEALFKNENKKKSLFGTMKKTDISDLNLRDHEDRI